MTEARGRAPTQSPPSSRLTGAALALGAEVREARIAPDTPYRDTAHDDVIAALPQFVALRKRLSASSRVRRLYGSESHRLALSWGYFSASPGDLRDRWREFWS